MRHLFEGGTVNTMMVLLRLPHFFNPCGFYFMVQLYLFKSKIRYWIVALCFQALTNMGHILDAGGSSFDRGTCTCKMLYFAMFNEFVNKSIMNLLEHVC